jgi:DNA-directed RNA polymerase subunit RPC12/RpoP
LPKITQFLERNPHVIASWMWKSMNKFWITHAYCSICGKIINLESASMETGFPRCPTCHHILRIRSTSKNHHGTRQARLRFIETLKLRRWCHG